MVDYVTEAKPAIIEQDGRLSLKVAATGIVLGIAVWGLTVLLERFVLRGLFCGDPSAAACVNITTYAGNIATVIVAIVGVVALVRLNVFRPLLIVLGGAISLWGMAAWLQNLGMVEQVLWSALLYALLYSLYAWVARIRNAVMVLIVFALVALATRLIPMFI
jgi:hypothetical protein